MLAWTSQVLQVPIVHWFCCCSHGFQTSFSHHAAQCCMAAIKPSGVRRLSRYRMFKQRTRKHKHGCVDDVIARGLCFEIEFPSIFLGANRTMHVLNFAYCCILSMLGVVNPFCDGMPLWWFIGVFQEIECSNNEPVSTKTAGSTT